MFPSDDPKDMKPEERFQELAAIFAKGYLRLQKYPGSVVHLKSEKSRELPGTIEQYSTEFQDKRLDSTPEQSVHTVPVNKLESEEKDQWISVS